MDDHAHHEIGAVDCGCGWHPSCVGLHPDPGVIEITEEGVAVVESGLTLRQAHEIRTGCSPEHLCDECESYLT